MKEDAAAAEKIQAEALERQRQAQEEKDRVAKDMEN